MKVKSHFEDVDQLIAKVKSATDKNKAIQAKFVTLSCQPQPVVTRWGNWLNLHYIMQRIYLVSKSDCGKF